MFRVAVIMLWTTCCLLFVAYWCVRVAYCICCRSLFCILSCVLCGLHVIRVFCLFVFGFNCAYLLVFVTVGLHFRLFFLLFVLGFVLLVVLLVLFVSC